MTLKGQARNAYPAMRIFIFGQEVTNDVIRCSPNWADDAEAPDVCEIELVNKGAIPSGAEIEDRYIITEKDIQALYADVDLSTTAFPDTLSMLANDPEAMSAPPTTQNDPELAQLGNAISAQNEFLNGVGPALGLNGLAGALSGLDSVVQRESAAYVLRARALQSNVDTQIRQRLSNTIQDVVKKRVLLAKFNKFETVSQPNFTETGTSPLTNQQRAAYLLGQAYRYPFTVGSWIFHTNDPVRVFWRDPFNSRIWYYKATGFVSDLIDNSSVDNVKTVTLRVENALRTFRYARVTTNPGIFDINQVKQAEDLVIQTFAQDHFAYLTLDELLYTMVFGPTRAGTVAALDLSAADVSLLSEADAPTLNRYNASGDSTSQQMSKFGVGAFDFNRSMTFVFGPSTDTPQSADNEDIASLELANRQVRLTGPEALGLYQAIVDHQVQETDLETMVLSGQAPISRQGMRIDPRTGGPRIEDVITAIGEHPELYPVDGGRLIILAPASLGPSTNRLILNKDLIQSLALQSTFSTRLAIIYDTAKRIEFVFYATPKGDIIFEMPLYDFEPADFGEVTTNPDRKLAAQYQAASTNGDTSLILEAALARQGFAPRYRIAIQDTMDHVRSFADEHVRTQFITSWSVLQGYANGGTVADVTGQKEVQTLRALVPQFGVRTEQAEPPAFISTPEAAKVYCDLKLNQWNAEALTVQIDVIPQLGIGPNRPLEIAERSYIATGRSIAHNLVWGGGQGDGDMSMSLGLNYARTWDGSYKPGTTSPLYSPIGGFASRPLNYGVLFANPNAQPASSGKTRPPGGSQGGT